MTTSYIIEIGYMSGHGWTAGSDAAWIELRKAAREIANHPFLIYVESKNFGAPDECPCGCGVTLQQHCEIYAEKDFNPMVIDDEKQQITLMASSSREMKEHTRRAFCRLIMAAMHRLNIEVSIVVA